MIKAAPPLWPMSVFLVARARFYDGPPRKRRRTERSCGLDPSLWPYSYLWLCSPGGSRHDEQAPPVRPGGADEARPFGWLYIR